MAVRDSTSEAKRRRGEEGKRGAGVAASCVYDY